MISYAAGVSVIDSTKKHISMTVIEVNSNEPNRLVAVFNLKVFDRYVSILPNFVINQGILCSRVYIPSHFDAGCG